MVVSGLCVGTEVTMTPFEVVSRTLVEIVTETLLDVVTGYVMTEVCMGQLVTSGGQSVTVIVLVV